MLSIAPCSIASVSSSCLPQHSDAARAHAFSLALPIVYVDNAHNSGPSCPRHGAAWSGAEHPVADEEQAHGQTPDIQTRHTADSPGGYLARHHSSAVSD